MIASFRIFRIIPPIAVLMILALSGTISADEFENTFESEQTPDISRIDLQEQLYVIISPASGSAPLSATLQVGGLDRTSFQFWELDWDGDGQIDAMGQGSPYQQITYTSPGDYWPVFNFYNERNEMITQARGSLTVTGAKSNGIDGTASQSQALTAAPSGWGIVKDTQAPGDRRPAQSLDNGQNGWSPPREEFTDYLRPELYASTERGVAPLTVSFDASRTYSLYGVMRYNFDVIWGPHEAEDDGYYLYSGNSPHWIHTFEEYGMYLAILDVEDNSGNRARTTKVIFVL